MKTLSYALVAFLLAFTCVAQAKDAVAPHYIDPTSVDLKTLLPGPSAVGSPDTQKEIDLVAEKQKERTPDAIARAKSEVKLKVFIFSDVLGPWFTAKNLPATDLLFKNIDSDTHLVTDQAKKIWDRPRPPLQDKDITPAVELEKNGSYPSGHATRGLLFALILADLAPDLKDQLIARGKEVGDDRVLAGVHFPSDVEAGQTLGTALYGKFTASSTFQADFAKAKAEFDAARAKK